MWFLKGEHHYSAEKALADFKASYWKENFSKLVSSLKYLYILFKIKNTLILFITGTL